MAGILDSSTMDVVTCEEEDHFQEADEHLKLQSLIDDTMNGWDSCKLEEYVNGDNDLASSVH